MKKIEIYTDGACKGNPGKGGWGAILIHDKHQKNLYGYEADTTNNRMELMAAIQALAHLKSPCEIDLTTDSQYVRKGITEWLENWKARNWKTASKKPVKNKDLWEQLDAQNERHNITWHWVKGHSGHPMNELADELANQGIEEEGTNL